VNILIFPQSNVLIDDNEVARLCDFGLVRLEDWAGHSGTTTTTEYRGTVRYRAPELFPSRDNRYSPIATYAGDIYALGGVMLEVSKHLHGGEISVYHVTTVH
jgi:serine/threonine protein kinase